MDRRSDPTGTIADRSRDALGRLTRARILGHLLLVIPGGDALTPPDDADDCGAFFESAPEGQFILDRGRRVRRANLEARRWFGRPGVELRGRSFSELFGPQAQPQVERALAAVGAGPRRSEPLVVAARAPDGSTLSMEIVVLPLRWGAEDGYGAVVRDRTGPTARAGAAPGPYTLGELLMANRLRELV